MRKLLSLMLVFGLVSIANGAFSGDLRVDGGSIGNSIDVQQGDTLVIQIYASNANVWSGYIVIHDGDDGALSSPHTYAAAGDFGGTNPYTESGWGNGYQVWSNYALTPPTSGVQHDFSIVTSGLNVGDSGKIALFDDAVGYNWNQNEADWTVFHVTPEPMTIVLLGLGGLFLRRRK